MSRVSHAAQLAFFDEDLKSPKHDEIMLWLDRWVREPGALGELFPGGDALASVDAVTWEARIHKVTYGPQYHLVGFLDLVCNWKLSTGGAKSVAFEVKSTVKSIGELLRQLRLYQEHAYYKTFCVVAPPHGEAQRICREQGFLWLDYIP